MSARKSRPSKNRQSFVLDCTGQVPWELLPNRGWFAVFDGLPQPFSDYRRLFVTNGTNGLRLGLKRHLETGMIRNPRRVYIETAASECDFTDPEYEGKVADILLGIDAIKRRGDERTLRRLRAALSRKGVKRGPKPRQDTRRWKIETLRELAAGKQLKASVAQAKRTPQSASAELVRFCRDFYECCWWLGAHTPDLWRGYVAGVLSERFGFQFPGDVEAAREAYCRGEESAGRDGAREIRN
jgi:hypothetical protein